MSLPEPLREPAQSGPCSRKRFNWPRHSIAEGGPKPRARAKASSDAAAPHAPLHPAPSGRRDLSLRDLPDPWEGQDDCIDHVPDDADYLYDPDPDGEPTAPERPVAVPEPERPVSLYASPSVVPPSDLAGLRATIDRFSGGYGSDRARRKTGFAELDASLPGGGLPDDAVIDCMGGVGSGVRTFAGRLLRDAHARGETVAVVDSTGTFSPVPMGIGGDRVLWLRLTSADPADAAWAIEQILRSRTVSLVVGLVPPRLSLPATRRMQLAAEAGSAMALLVREPEPAVSACAAELRFEALPSSVTRRQSRLTVMRVRGGSPGATFVLSTDDAGETIKAAAPGERAPLRVAGIA